MKIIGTTDHGFIIEATKQEASRLIGYYSHYSDHAEKLKVGAEIQVNAMYDQLYKIASIKGQVKAILDAAGELAEAVRTRNPIIEPVVRAVTDAMPKDK